MAKREYIRYDPDWAEKLEAKGYPDGAIVAFARALGAAEGQNPRGFFKNSTVLRGHLGRHARWIRYLIGHGDLIEMPDGRIYFEGWEEWQEGDWKVRERVSRIRNRKKPAPESMGSTVTPVTPPSDTLDTASTDTTVTSPTVTPPSDRNRNRNRNRGRWTVDGGVTAARAADGLATESPEVMAYGERFIKHGRVPSGEDLEFLRGVPYAYDRLTQASVLGVLDEIAAKFKARDKPMPPAKYLAGPLGDRQAAAADAGIRPARSARSPGMSRIGDVLAGGNQ